MLDSTQARHAKTVPKKKQKRSTLPPVLQELLQLLLKIAAIVLSAVLLLTFVYGLHRNQDPAMQPAIQDGDLVLFYRLDKHYYAQDTVALSVKGKTQIRRVVATAGDTVDITENGLMINGALQQEPNIYEPTHRYQNSTDFPLTIGEGQIFVLGDSRENATDSRVYGPIETKETLGKVMFLVRRRSI